MRFFWDGHYNLAIGSQEVLHLVQDAAARVLPLGEPRRIARLLEAASFACGIGGEFLKRAEEQLIVPWIAV
jgi:hypothetical protein